LVQDSPTARGWSAGKKVVPDIPVAQTLPVFSPGPSYQEVRGEPGLSTGSVLVPRCPRLLHWGRPRRHRPRYRYRGCAAWEKEGALTGGDSIQRTQITGQSLPVIKAVSLSCLHCSAWLCYRNSQETLTHATRHATNCPLFSPDFSVYLSRKLGSWFPRLLWSEIFVPDSFPELLQSIQEE
jgi:hypothetical protein